MEDRRIVAVGDRALTVYFENRIDVKVNQRVHLLAKKVREADFLGIEEIIPGFRSLMIHYNPLLLSFSTLFNTVEELVRNLEDHAVDQRVIWEVPVCYEEEFAPDMANFLAYTGLNREEAIHLHTHSPYPIYMLGFLPGFPYLGGLDERLHMPRLEQPRVAIKAGSIGIAGGQTGVYPSESPGGWQIIGRSPLFPFEQFNEESVPYQAGDAIQFYSISAATFYSLLKKKEAGINLWRKREGEAHVTDC